jgi:hypothetical protein
VGRKKMFLLITLLPMAIAVASSEEYASRCRNFNCEIQFKLLSKLIHLEVKAAKQDNMIAKLTAKLECECIFINHK